MWQPMMTVDITVDVNETTSFVTEDSTGITHVLEQNSTVSFVEISSTLSINPLGVADNDTLKNVSTDSPLVDNDPTEVSRKIGDPTSDRCSILDEFGSWDFFYKYSRDEVSELMCVCNGLCIDDIEPPAGVDGEDDDDPDGDEFLSEEEDRVTFVAVTTVYSAIFGFGLIGNVLTICGLVFWMKSRSATFLLILGLACSDLLVVLVCLPLKEIEFFRISTIFEGYICKIVYYIKDFSLACSVLTLTVISFERFYAICYPLKAQFRCNTRRARVLIVIIWLTSAVLASPTIIAMKSYKSAWTNTNLCHSNFQDSLHTKLYFIYFLAILYVLPLTVMCYTYGRSCLALWRSAKIVRNMQGKDIKKKCVDESDASSGYSSTTIGQTNSKIDKTTKDKEQSANTVEKRKQVLQLLLSLLVVFVVCWGPTLVIHVLTAFNIRISHFYITRLTAETLAFFNSCLNPYLFMAMSSQFRKTLYKKLSCGGKDISSQSTALGSKFTASSTGISTLSVDKYA
ncbi:QRFP-like peptide receptor [Patella vulgata]|uniref:QRFP-like peptide receptor n=1 Tax=Patella vulgata TaxID=6465 RepID=UPI00217F42D5|nr:QRFP-like peptide receptor [Patella vulgata]